MRIWFDGGDIVAKPKPKPKPKPEMMLMHLVGDVCAPAGQSDGVIAPLKVGPNATAGAKWNDIKRVQ